MDDEKTMGSTMAILLLTQPNKPDQSKKVEAYTFLTSLLKGKSCKAAINADVFASREEIIEVILSDICFDGGGGVMSQLVPHALQTLGYLLFNERLARNLDAVRVSRIIEGICDLAKKSSMVKSVCTHCLWCLANQNLDKRLLSSQVSLMSSTIHHLIISTQTLPSPSTVSEVVNVLEKLLVQCAEELMKNAKVWYEPMVAILFSKYTKVHQKVLKFLVTCEPLLSLNSSLVFWLGKELKNHLISTMLTSLSSKHLDHYVMSTWAHFVCILGKALHLSGTFLNRMLKVVEMGFKHIYKPVQIAAYTAWRNVIDNFSTNLDLIKTPKKLDLLLLPLVSSALKCRDKEVDRVRVVTWWHLIGNLLAHDTSGDKSVVFRKVCLPMILFCLGLNPKTDTSTVLDSTTSESPPRWKFAALFEPSASSSSSVPSSTHYPFTPTAEMLYSAGHAMLQLIGQDVNGSGLTLRPLLKCSLLYSESVSLSTLPCLVPSLLLVAEGLSTYGSLLEPLAVQPFLTNLLSFVITYLKKHSKEPSSESLLVSLIDLIEKSTIMDIGKKMGLLSQLGELPSSVLVSILCKHTLDGRPYWEQLQRMILTYLAALYPADEHRSDLLELYGQVTAAVCSSQRAEQRLAIYRKLFSLLEDVFPTQTEDTRALLGQCWCVLAGRFTNFLKEAGIINEGSFSKPDFSLVLKILEFPFQHAIPRGDVQSSPVVQTWKKLFFPSNINIGLTVKDSTLAAKLISDRLLPAAKMALVAVSNSSTENLIDSYLTSLACASQCLAVRLFSSLSRKGNLSIRKGWAHTTGPIATLHSLCSLISWQLQESSLILSHVKDFSGDAFPGKSAHLLLEIVAKLYTNLSNSDLLQHVTETLSSPLYCVLKTVLSINPSTQQDPRLLTELHEKAQFLWNTICTQFNLYWEKDNNPHEALTILSPLLEVTLLCEVPKVIDTTVQFWNSRFGMAKSLDYPPILRNAASSISSELANRIKLPPHSGNDETVIGEKMDKGAGDDKESVNAQKDLEAENRSDMMEVEESEPFIPSSSVRPVENCNKTSPTPSSSAGGGATPAANQKARRLLTQHQKEKQRERPYIPVMYNTLDQSQTTQPLSPWELSELPVVTSSSCAPLAAATSLVTVSAPHSDSSAPLYSSTSTSADAVVSTDHSLVSASPDLVAEGSSELVSDQATPTAVNEDASIASKQHSDVIDLTDSSPLSPYAYNSALDDPSQTLDTADNSRPPSTCVVAPSTVPPHTTAVHPLVTTLPPHTTALPPLVTTLPSHTTVSTTVSATTLPPTLSDVNVFEPSMSFAPVSLALVPVSSGEIEAALDDFSLPVTEAVSPTSHKSIVNLKVSSSFVKPVDPRIRPVNPVELASLVETVNPVSPVELASPVESVNPVSPVEPVNLVPSVESVDPVPTVRAEMGSCSITSIIPSPVVQETSAVEQQPVIKRKRGRPRKENNDSNSKRSKQSTEAAPSLCSVSMITVPCAINPYQGLADCLSLPLILTDTQTSHQPAGSFPPTCSVNDTPTTSSAVLVTATSSFSTIPSVLDTTSSEDIGGKSTPVEVVGCAFSGSPSEMSENMDKLSKLLHSQPLHCNDSSQSLPSLTSGQQQGTVISPEENYPVVTMASSEALGVVIEPQQIGTEDEQKHEENTAGQDESLPKQDMECENEQKTKEYANEQTVTRQEEETERMTGQEVTKEESSDQRMAGQEDSTMEEEQIIAGQEKVAEEQRMTEEESNDQTVTGQDGVVEEQRMTEDDQTVTGQDGVVEEQRMTEDDQTVTGQDGVVEEQRMTEDDQTVTGQDGVVEEQRMTEDDQTVTGQDGVVEEQRMTECDQTVTGQDGVVEEQRMTEDDQTVTGQDGVVEEQRKVSNDQTMAGQEEVTEEESSDQRMTGQDDVQSTMEEEQIITGQEKVQQMTEEISNDQTMAGQDEEQRMTEDDQTVTGQDGVVEEQRMTEDDQTVTGQDGVVEEQRMTEEVSNDQTMAGQDEEQRMTEEEQTTGQEKLAEEQRIAGQENDTTEEDTIDQNMTGQEELVNDQRMEVEDSEVDEQRMTRHEEQITIAEGQAPGEEMVLDKEEILGIVEESEQDDDELRGSKLLAEESKQHVEECEQEIDTPSMLEEVAIQEREEDTNDNEKRLNEEDSEGIVEPIDLQSDIVEESEEPEEEVPQDTNEEAIPGDNNEDPLPASSPTNCPTIGPFSPVTPVGILKHTSRYDSPTSANKERRVQFATPVIATAQDPPADYYWTPVHTRTHKKSSRNSRRALQLSPRSNKPAGSPSSAAPQPVSPLQSLPWSSKTPIFPSLIGCNVPIDVILPSLSTSGNRTYGLKNIMCARNITTIGDISSLCPEEIEKLPLKPPKPGHLWSVLKSFKANLAQEEVRKRPSQKRPRDNQRNESVSKKHKKSSWPFSTHSNETRSLTDVDNAEEARQAAVLEDRRETERHANMEAEQPEVLEDRQNNEERPEELDNGDTAMLEDRHDEEQPENGDTAMLEDRHDEEQPENSDTAMLEDKHDEEQPENGDTAMLEDQHDEEQPENGDTAMLEDRHDEEQPENVDTTMLENKHEEEQPEELENSDIAMLEDRQDEEQCDTAMLEDKQDEEQPDELENSDTAMLEDRQDEEQPETSEHDEEQLENVDTAMLHNEEQPEELENSGTTMLKDRQDEELPEDGDIAKLVDRQDNKKQPAENGDTTMLEDRHDEEELENDNIAMEVRYGEEQPENGDTAMLGDNAEQLEEPEKILEEKNKKEVEEKEVSEQDTEEEEHRDNDTDFNTGFEEESGRDDKVTDMEETDTDTEVPAHEDDAEESKIDVEEEEEQVVLYTPESQRGVATPDNALGTVECSNDHSAEQFPYDANTAASIVDKFTELSRLKQLSRQDLKVLAASCNTFISAYLDL